MQLFKNGSCILKSTDAPALLVVCGAAAIEKKNLSGNVHRLFKVCVDA